MVSRRRNVWVSTQTDFPVLISTQGAVNLLLQSAVPLVGLTVTRELLSLSIRPAIDEAAEDSALLTYGLVVMSTDAAVALAFEDPESPEQTDWLMLDHAVVTKEAAGGQQEVTHRVYDLRGQRKFGNMDVSLYLVFNSVPLFLTLDIDVAITSRILLKMP